MGALTAALAGFAGDDDREANGPTDDSPTSDSLTGTFDPAGDLPYGQSVVPIVLIRS
jgi:hypothetical protein